MATATQKGAVRPKKKSMLLETLARTVKSPSAKLGAALGITPEKLPQRLEDTLASLGLPTSISCTMDDYTAAIGLDKKGAGAEITLILLDKMGHAVPHKISKTALLEQIKALPGR